jgi:DNA-binding NtrC family response regulator
MAINCGAVPGSLIESELFGHVRGAFTGAQRAHRGIFEEAGRGTVLLDEIGEIPPRLQVALLRVLETGEIRPVGSAASRTVACRIVAATNADLEALAAAKRFRPDLLYRLRHLEIRVPPLRERTADVLPLAAHFLGLGRREGERPVIGPGLRARLLANPWPGNVRELRSVIERMRLLNSDKLSYDAEDLDPPGAAPAAPSGTSPFPAAAPEREATAPAGPGPVAPSAASAGDVAAFLRAGRSPLRRRERLRELFRQHGHMTRTELAAILGISPFTITRDMKLLVREGFVEKHQPTASPRTHYFALKKPPDAP